VSFSLRGVSLAAMDINIVGKNSSDPYYILYAVDASGQLKRLGKSNTVKADLNPSWEVLELTSEDMGGARRLKVLSPTPIALTLTPTLAPSPNPTLALTPTLTLALPLPLTPAPAPALALALTRTRWRCGTTTWARRATTSSGRPCSSSQTCRS
jgi:hypothetical protein